MAVFGGFSFLGRFFDAKFRFFKKKFLDFWILTVLRSVNLANVENAVIWMSFLEAFYGPKKRPFKFSGFFSGIGEEGSKKGIILRV